MGRVISIGLAVGLMAGPGWAQNDERRGEDQPGANLLVLGGGHELLAQGAELIRYGSYDEGIRLTTLGLEEEATTARDRAMALSNLCGAYAAKQLPDIAIDHCNRSLAINNSNWRAYSNRAYAYWLKGMYAEATFDVDAAMALSPRARQALQIKGMINEAGLRPRVTMEDHQ